MISQWIYYLLSTWGITAPMHPSLQATEIVEQATPTHLYKIISLDQWDESQKNDYLILSSSDQPFIHLAKEDQILSVVKKFWQDKPYIVLKLRTDQLPGKLIYETNPGGSTFYYHLYAGSIPLKAVIEVISSQIETT